MEKTEIIETSRPLSQSELVQCMKAAMDPIFEHFEEKLLEKDGRELLISVKANGGNINLGYSVVDLEE